MLSELTHDELTARHQKIEERLMDMPEDDDLFRRLDDIETRLREERVDRLLSR